MYVYKTLKWTKGIFEFFLAGRAWPQMAIKNDDFFVKIKPLYLCFAKSDPDQSAHVCPLSHHESMSVSMYSAPYWTPPQTKYIPILKHFSYIKM